MNKYRLTTPDGFLEYLNLIDAQTVAADLGIIDPEITTLEITAADPNAAITLAVTTTLRRYQEAVPTIMQQLAVINSLAGITVPQSNQMLTDYADVILRIMSGALPAAIYCLMCKSPAGAITQDIIDAWLVVLRASI